MSDFKALNILKVDLSKLTQNYINISEFVDRSCEVAATVKADAYGLGVTEIANALSEAGCNKFFTFTLKEAMLVRTNSMTDEIFVYNGIFDGEQQAFLSNNIIPVLNSITQIELWLNFAMKKGTKLPAVIQVDTGMTRLGINYLELIAYLKDNMEILAAKLKLKYIMSHLACAEDEHDLNKQQLEKMLSLKKIFPQIKLSLANSAGILLGKEFHLDLVRPGALLYGFVPNFKKVHFISEVAEYYSTLSQIRIAENDSSVGYGATKSVKKGAKLGVVSIGYADGFFRNLTNKGKCYIEDYPAPIVGRVSMDCTVLDVTEVPDKFLFEGAQVEILGPNSSIADIATTANTTGWEVLTSLGNGRRYEKMIVRNQGHYNL